MVHASYMSKYGILTLILFMGVYLLDVIFPMSAFSLMECASEQKKREFCKSTQNNATMKKFVTFFPSLEWFRNLWHNDLSQKGVTLKAAI